MKYISVFVTVPTVSCANEITKLLLEKKLVSCVSIVSGLKSVYRWKGKICKSKERLLMMKSVSENFNAIVKEIKKIHPYEVPEIVRFEIDANKDYLDWIKENVE